MIETLKGKLIFSPQLAEYLLQCGYRIINLKHKRGTENETVFAFAYEKSIETQIQEWTQEKVELDD